MELHEFMFPVGVALESWRAGCSQGCGHRLADLRAHRCCRHQSFFDFSARCCHHHRHTLTPNGRLPTSFAILRQRSQPHELPCSSHHRSLVAHVPGTVKPSTGDPRMLHPATPASRWSTFPGILPADTPVSLPHYSFQAVSHVSPVFSPSAKAISLND